MKCNFQLLATVVLTTIFLFSCGKESANEMNEEINTEDSTNHDCTFTQIDGNMDGLIDPTEKEIMNECTNNLLTSTSEIKENLIGEWKLIGHGEGWVPTVSQPCGYITFFENELKFEFDDGWQDTISMHQWDIKKVETTTGNVFGLEITPNTVYGLTINQFCLDYMYGDATPVDGNMYLYEKVN